LSVVQPIEGDTGGKANILVGDNIGHFEKKYLVKNTEIL